MQRYLTWRIGRKEYAIALATFAAGYLAINYLVSPQVAQVLPLIWIVALAVPRLRDIGWSVWWSLGPFGAGFVGGFLNSYISRTNGSPWPAGPILQSLIGWASIAFMLFLAFKRSKPKPLAETFA